MKWLLFCLPFCLMIGGCWKQDVNFEQQVTGRIMRAANADSVLLARMELDAAIEAAESRGLTNGSTHVFYYTPDKDVRFWFRNLKEAKENLDHLPASADALTTSNQLMRLRNTLLDHSSTGEKVTCPENAFLYPNQVNWFCGFFLSAAAVIYGITKFVIEEQLY